MINLKTEKAEHTTINIGHLADGAKFEHGNIYEKI